MTILVVVVADVVVVELIIPLPHVVKIDLYPSPQEIHHVLDLLQVPAHTPQVPRVTTGARGQQFHSLLQVNIRHVREYQLPL